MRYRLLLTLAFSLFATPGWLDDGRAATTRPGPTLGRAPTTCVDQTAGDTGFAYTVCTGKIPASDDYTPLDVDFTVPTADLDPTGQPIAALPLVVMMHGWGNSKTEWESGSVGNSDPDKDRYNNVSFASRGYAVLNYSARGFHGSCGPDLGAAEYAPPCDRGWTHLADRRFEIADTHKLAGDLADAGVADPQKVAVTGGSYGGGQSWLLALEADQDTVPGADANSAATARWVSRRGRLMHLVVAVPKYPWTDLIDALQPNGRSSDGVNLPDGDRVTPYGVEKASYVSGLFTLGASTAQYAKPLTDLTADLVSSYADTNKGEPYSLSDPVLANSVQQIESWKSPFYQDALIQADKGTHEVPVLDIQGFTDSLFPESQAIALINKLKAADSNWPVSVLVGDVGHANAQNKAADWRLFNSAANDFIDHYMFSQGKNVNTYAEARITTCDATVGDTFFAPSWFDLTGGATLSPSLTPGRAINTTTSAVVDATNGAGTDPIVQGSALDHHGCITRTSNPDDSLPAGSVATWTAPLTADLETLGAPILALSVSVSGTNAEIDGRIWDVAPDGTTTLVTRGGYRFDRLVPTLDTQTTETITYQLQGNGWLFKKGHTILLEVTQDDSPYFRPDNLASSINYNAAKLTFPVANPSLKVTVH